MIDILPRSKAFSAIVVIVCFVLLFIILTVSLVAAERQIDSMTVAAQEMDQKIQDQEQIILAQQELVNLYQEQNVALASLLGQTSETLQGIAYGPYTREEIQDLIAEVADIIQEVNQALDPKEVEEISQVIVRSAVAADIDPLLLVSMAITESHCRPDVRGGSGEYGMLQVMPGTGRWIAGRLGYAEWQPGDMLDISTNVQFAAYYLRVVTREFNGDTQRGVLAYNRGSAGARSWMAENSPTEHYYVRRVMGTYSKLGGV